MARKSCQEGQPPATAPAAGYGATHAEWRRSISAGMARAAKSCRREARTVVALMEVSVHHGLPMRFVKSVPSGKAARCA